MLEVERLELDHFWEIHRQQLEQRDQAGSAVRDPGSGPTCLSFDSFERSFGNFGVKGKD